MGYRRDPFAPGEYYHIYSRGIDKRVVFANLSDFQRFKKLLYLANDAATAVDLDLIKNVPYPKVFSIPRTQPLVAIAAYCLMNNHPHIVMREVAEGGVTRFMHKIGTAYTTYFNKKYDRIGNLMVKPFRAKHIDTDAYLRQCVQYVHLNPAELFEHGWKSGIVQNVQKLQEHLIRYQHSSLSDYVRKQAHPEQAILDKELFEMIRADLPPLFSVLDDAAKYYREIDLGFEPKKKGPQKGSTYKRKASPFF